MATSTSSNSFPLATDGTYTEGDSGPGSISSGGNIDDAAGASGSSPGAIQISHGAIVAIIVVVAVVCVLGSKFPYSTSPIHSLDRLTGHSFHGCIILPGQEERMENQGKYSTLSKEGRHCPYASSL